LSLVARRSYLVNLWARNQTETSIHGHRTAWAGEKPAHPIHESLPVVK
jgi:hypothetical protein